MLTLSMMAIFGAIWIGFTLHNCRQTVWYVRNVASGAAFFLAIIAGRSSSIIAPSADYLNSILIALMFWAIYFVVVGLPATLIYYLVKRKKFLC